MDRKRLCGILLGVLLFMAAGVGPARAGESYRNDLGWGMAAAGCTMFYSPAKVVYAILGALTGGMVYAWTAGGLDVSQRVWSTTMGGTYVITPAMLRGEKSVLFAGRTYGW